MSTEQQLVAISLWINDHNATRNPSEEATMWSRCMKVGEEAGEVQEALRAYLGENPRKPRGTLDDVVEELLDTAVAALAAVEHLCGHSGASLELLENKVGFVYERAGLDDGQHL